MCKYLLNIREILNLCFFIFYKGYNLIEMKCYVEVKCFNISLSFLVK